MFKCIKCGKYAPVANQKFYTVKGSHVPTAYMLCNEHKHVVVTEHDIYLKDGSGRTDMSL